MKKYLFYLTVFIIILYLCFYYIPFSSPSTSHVRIIAHRGDSANAPENTIPAVMSAITNDADCIELDVRCTKDGVPIVFHDATLRRLTGVKAEVSDLTYREITSYPLHFANAFSNYPQTTACTLEDVLLLVAKQPGLCLHLELKASGTEEKVVSLLQKYDSVCSYKISSANPGILQTIHQIAPSLELTLVLTCAGDVFEYCTQPPETIDSISVKSCFVTSPLIHLAHRRGHKIYAWTVNKTPSARRLIRIGVDGLITDDPSLLHKTLS